MEGETTRGIASSLSTGFGATVLAGVASCHYDSPCLHTVNPLKSGGNTISSLHRFKPNGFNGFPQLLLPECLNFPCWVPDLHWLLQFLRTDM